jgi:hypothetical protein
MRAQRYLATYTYSGKNGKKKMTFGVYAKKYRQAITRTQVYIYQNDLHGDKTLGYDLTAEPSRAPADYEIPVEEEEVEV